jgi:hypothetical protein
MKSFARPTKTLKPQHPTMKKLLIIIGLIAVNCLAPAQTAVLYQQDFGTVNGGTSLAAVGWSQVLLTGGYSGFYTQSGAVDGTTAAVLPASTLYFGGNSGTGVFYTTNSAGSGTGGDSSFTSIDPTLYTNLNISVESQWSYNGGNLNCWFTVEVGGTWYVSTNAPITTLQHSAGGIFYQSAITYNPAATNWNILTNTTVAGIGPKASANLVGDIAGIGIVAELSGSGSWDYNNFLITSISNTVAQPPTLTAAPLSQENYAGAGVSFAVGATGSAPLTYIWEGNGVVLTNNNRVSGANTATVTLQNINANDAGTYSVIVSNATGLFDSSTNSVATLTVDSLPADYLYAETFPFVGPYPVNYPLSAVGWSNSIADDVDRLFQSSGGYGAFFAYESSAITTAFYVTTNSDSGASGLPFPAINPSTYPAVSFSVNIAPTYQPADVAAYFAVQMSGGNWYAQSTPIPVNTSTASGTYSTCAQSFSSLAANWDDLALTATNAVIGAAAASNLAGNITGAGLVLVYSGSGGNFNIDNFLVLTDAVAAIAPVITEPPYSQTVYAGAGVSFAGTASGTQPVTYYWQFNGNTLTNGGNISGANSNVLTLVNVNDASAGQYSLLASNSAGTDSSANYVTTELTVDDAPTNLLYAEEFPFVGPLSGNYPVSAVGWLAAVPDAPTRLYQIQAGEGAVYNSESVAGTTAFYATTASDTGLSGLPFPNINIASTSNLVFAVDIAPTYEPTNLTASLAVEINDSTWYVSTTNLPVDTSSVATTFTTVSEMFSPTATNWNRLTLASTGATIGGVAGANLSGNITGAGLVFNFTGAGNFNFDNFQITGNVAAGPGSLSPGSRTATSLTLNWTASPNVQLQSTTNLDPPVVWSDVPDTAGQGMAMVPLTGAKMFFRLISE